MKQGARLLKGFSFKLLKVGIFVNIFFVGLQFYHNPFKAFKGLKILNKFGKKIFAGSPIKGYYINGKYGWGLFHPVWPSKAFNNYFKGHLEEVLPSSKDQSTLRYGMVAITKKCPLRCEHCSEWHTLNQPGELPLEDLTSKINSLVDDGMSMIVYTGGEPLSRFSDLLELTKTFASRATQWVFTSGFGFTKNKAKELKNAGMQGVALSLDNNIEELHDSFRGKKGTYKWVRGAIKYCKENNMLVALNICPTKEFIRQDQFPLYMENAKKWGVDMVNIIEPQAVGHYEGKDIMLSEDEHNYLKDHFSYYNFNSDFNDYPIIVYAELAQKGVGCGGGKRFIFMDYDGTLRPCPFCKTVFNPDEPDRVQCEFPKIGVGKVA